MIRMMILVLALLGSIGIPAAGEDAVTENPSAFALALRANWGVEDVAGEKQRSVILVEEYLAGPLAGRGEGQVDAEVLLKRIKGLVDAVEAVADDEGDIEAMSSDDTLAAVRWVDALEELRYPRLGLPRRESAAFARTLAKEVLRLHGLLADPYLAHGERMRAFREEAWASKDGEAAGAVFSAGGASRLSADERAKLAEMQSRFMTNVHTLAAFRSRVIQLLEHRSDHLAFSDRDLRQILKAIDPEGLHGKENLREHLPRIYELLYDEKP